MTRYPEIVFDHRAHCVVVREPIPGGIRTVFEPVGALGDDVLAIARALGRLANLRRHDAAMRAPS